MELFAEIRQDHQKVKRILSELAETTNRATKTRQEGLASLRRDLSPHMLAEEQVFYPALDSEREMHEHVLEGLEEHRLGKMVLQELGGIDTSDDVWGAKAKVLMDLVEHHIEEEESNILPGAEKMLKGEKLQTVTERFRAVKQQP